MKPVSTLWLPHDWLLKMKLDPLINALSAASHPRSALFLRWPMWWFDESYCSRCLTMSIFFCLCLSVFQSQPQHYHVVSVLNQKLSYTASVFECGRAGGACMCYMVLTLITFGCFKRQGKPSTYNFSRAIGGLSSKDGYLQISFPIVFFTLPWYW